MGGRGKSLDGEVDRTRLLGKMGDRGGGICVRG